MILKILLLLFQCNSIKLDKIISRIILDSKGYNLREHVWILRFLNKSEYKLKLYNDDNVINILRGLEYPCALTEDNKKVFYISPGYKENEVYVTSMLWEEEKKEEICDRLADYFKQLKLMNLIK